MPNLSYDFESMGLGDLLRKSRMTVPPNQRPYAWEEQHVQTLLRDFLDALNSDEKNYFMGTVVLIKDEDHDPNIADGQQRIATTSILLARIRDAQIALKRSGRAEAIDNEYLRRMDMDTEQKVANVQLNVEDHHFFVERILPTPEELGTPLAPPTSASNRKLLKASQVIGKFVDSLLEPMNLDQRSDYLNKWVTFIKTSASVVVVTASDEIGAYRMFETLNDRGLKASQADILKNFVFSKAGTRLQEAQMLWHNISSALEALGDEDNERLVTFLRHYWVLEHGPTKERELAGKIKVGITGENSALNYLNGASKAVHDYVALSSSHDKKWQDYSSDTRKAVDVIAQQLQVEQIKPLLFAIATRLSVQEAQKAFDLCVSWSVRFLIFGGRGGMLDEQYSRRAQQIGKGEITKASELRDAMANYVPTDAEFEAAFSTARVSRARLARYYLRAIENVARAEKHPELVPNEDVESVNLEHVLPLKPGNDWNVNDEEAEAVQKLLGNMALMATDKNIKIGNAKFEEKAKIFAQSEFITTKEIATEKLWGAEQIKGRQANLAKTAVKAWPLAFKQ